MTSGVELLVVIAGGSVVTFFVVAIFEFIKVGRARRVRESIEGERMAERLGGAEVPPTGMPEQEPVAVRREEPGER